ncbi:serpin family protein [Actinomadura logoneensis]|uniref:Serpin family protein n=1 Tax=Actinomadura logoneensis TaxID=2293572 RepID=A0A372JHB5_9ACTN|nr:serpin family protein [Actinomadura logoneensis]RFU39402.1 serpin family protein [Actinomadura logoneensis]
MPTPRSLAAAVCAAALAAALAACGDQPPRVHELRGAVLDVPPGDPRPLGRADTAFGFGLLSAWCAADPNANIVLSPSSVASSLGMIHQGARGETAAAMARALHLPSGDLLPGLRARTAALRALGDKKTSVRVSDQIWATAGVPTDKNYLARLATGYDAGVKTLDFAGAPEDARKAINAQIKKDTGGKIPELLTKGQVQSDTGWVLTDAVYLKAEWRTRFKEASPDRFTTSDKRVVQAKLMNARSRFGYAHTAGWTAADLPYAGGGLRMTALLPDATAPGCPALTGPLFDRLTGALGTGTDVDVFLPKTDLTSRRELTPLLTRLGMGVAFSGRADLHGISPKADRIQFVQHAATLRVDEKGTEGAAATGGGVSATALPAPVEKIEVVFDRPYVMVVRDAKTGEPLFMARVADPTRQ